MLVDIGKLVLRLSVGILMLFHGVYKAVYGIDGVENLIDDMGLPSFMAYGVYVGEILAPVMIILGFRVKIAAVLVVLTMIVAMLAVSGGNIFTLNQTGGWTLELQGLYLFGALAIFFLDSGRFALDIDVKKGK